MSTVHRLRLEHLTAGAVALTVFSFGTGSSSVGWLHQVGSHVKWVALAALLVPAVRLSASGRSARGAMLAVYASSALLLLAAFESALWSVDPWTTIKKAISLGLLLTVAGALGLAVGSRAVVARPLAVGVVVGGTFYALASFLLLAVDEAEAVQLPNPGTPTRFRGLSENPNTISLLCALLLPLAVWSIAAGRGRAARSAGVASALLLYVAVALSGSRGALVGVLTGLGTFAVLSRPDALRRGAALAAATLAFVLGVGLSEFSVLVNPTATTASSTATTSSLPTTTSPSAATTSSSTPAVSAPHAKSTTGTQPTKVVSVPPPLPTPHWSLLPHALQDEIGSRDSGPRQFFGTSGRSQAWAGALGIGAKRPVTGYGFGTEQEVFVDRWAAFQGSVPENSYIGIFLQLGVVGLGLLLAIGVAVFVAGRRALALSDRSLAAALLATCIAGATLAVGQSYLYAVGNLATVPLWIALFLLAGLASRRDGFSG